MPPSTALPPLRCRASQVVCSTYYSFCGNASPGPGLLASGLAAGLGRGNASALEPRLGWKEAVCHKWLHPVSASSHSAFTRWVIYGEATANETQAAGAPAEAGGRLWRSPVAAANGSTLQIDIPLDGKVGVAAGPMVPALG